MPAVFLGLINNIALLVALSVVHGLIVRHSRQSTLLYQFFSGVLFGVVGVIGMFNALVLAPGLIFDGRSIILGVAGLFGGPLSAAVAALICAAHRYALGGIGALMGVGVIVESALLGVGYHYLRRVRPDWVRPLHLYIFGTLVHLVMLAMMLLIPGGMSAMVWREIAAPVILIYPLATVLVCLLFLDLEDRIRAQDALRRSEEKYRELVESVNSIILRWKDDGVITFMNGFGLRFFGYREEELVGRHVVGTIVPETDSAGRDLVKMIADIINDPENHAINENENICRDGRRVWVRWSNRPVCDASGRLVEMLCVGSDITDRVQAEEAHRKLEERLRLSQKMEAVGLLAGGVAHDLNNLLSPIMGYSEMLLDADIDEAAKTDVREILGAAGRARDLVHDLMAFGGKQTLDMRPLDLNAVVGPFSRLLRRTLREDIRIELELAPCLPAVRADRGQLEQVLMNLAVNAQDAMRGGGRLLIRTRAEGGADGTVALSVADNGTGIDAATLPRIFEPFFTTKPRGMGSGFGLATVHGIVEQHGGAIYVDSAPGRGSTFTVSLPVCDEPPEEEWEPPAQDTPAPRGQETILVAEDNQTVRNMLCAILDKLGYRVVTAETALECLEAARRPDARVDLLLTDVIMPDMNGRELRARMLETHPGLRTLFVSGHSDNILDGQMEFGGQTGFLQKPFTRQGLAEKLRELLDA